MSRTALPYLEVTRYPAQGAPRITPLLFVHGAWHSAACWSAYFLPYFAGQGYDCYAINLRGHSKSAGRERLRWMRIRDYVSDVARLADDIADETGARPAVIGHSMGGFIVQKYLAQYDAPAGVLLASIPAHGALPAIVRISLRYPLTMLRILATFNLYPVVEDRARFAHLFLSGNFSADEIDRYHAMTQDESFAMMFDVGFLDLPRARPLSTPLLVVGGGRDGFFTPAEIERTARAYGTGAHIFRQMGHNLMVEPEWERVADLISGWLADRLP